MLNTRLRKVLLSVLGEVQAEPGDSAWKSRTVQALHTALADPDTEEASRYREAALSKLLPASDTFEIDRYGVVSMGPEGAFVQTWVWVSREELS